MNPQQQLVAQRAYAHWLRNDRPQSSELQDWLDAETEIQRELFLAAPAENGSAGLGTQLLQVLLDNSPAAVFVKDTVGRYVLINRKCETYAGPPEQVCGKNDEELFPPQFAQVFRRTDQQVLATGRAQGFEEQVPTADGIHSVFVWKVPIQDNSGRPLAICGIVTDLTAQKEAAGRVSAEHAVTRVLAESDSLAVAGPRIIQAICDGLGWDMGILWRVDAIAQVLRCAEVWHAPDVQVPTFEARSRAFAFPMGIGLPGRIWKSGEPSWITNVVVDDNFPRRPAALADGLHGGFGFPLRDERGILGVLEFFSRNIREPDQKLLDMMGSIGSQIAQFVERRQVEKALHQREREFSVARTIQQHRLPRVVPNLPGITCHGRSQPTQETGGDYYDFVPMANGCLGIAIGDASGHGISAALLMAETRAYLRGLARTRTDPSAVLTLVNQHVAEDIGPDHFVTLFLGCLDPRTRRLTCSNAGHWPGMVMAADGQIRATLHATWPPLGVEAADAVPAGDSVALAPGDLLVLITDGIVEAAPEQGGQFGAERLFACVRRHRHEAPAVIIAALFEEVLAYTGGHQFDDHTALVLKVTP